VRERPACDLRQDTGGCRSGHVAGGQLDPLAGEVAWLFDDQGGEERGLASAPLRELAARLAADPDLTVSVITYQDGSQELEVLHTGPPHCDADTVDCRRFTRQAPAVPARPLSIASPAGLHDAVSLIRAVLRDAATT
jgi:hypothetical protein